MTTLWSDPLYALCAVVFAGFLASEVWRWLGALLSSRMDENSALLAWVKMVAAALIAGVVVKLAMSPTGLLGSVPVSYRLIALGAGGAACLLFKRSVVMGLVVGQLVLLSFYGLAFWR